MRSILVAFFLALAVGTATQKGPNPIVGKKLSAATKPIHLIPEIAGKPALNVSEYFMRDVKKRQRVFRYSWKGDITSFLTKIKSRYVGKNGWAFVDHKDGAWELKRAMKGGQVIMESYLIKSARLSLDPKAPQGLRVDKTTPGPNGWIWVSYNERYAK
jgi:hypothetical protein